MLEQFCAITGAPQDVGNRMLEACSGNLEMAVNMFVDAAEVPQLSPERPQPPPTNATSVIMSPVVVDSEDGIRDPIPPTRGILVEEPFTFGVGGNRRPPRSIFDGFRDFEAETRRQEQELLNPSSLSSRQRRQTLEDLFRPPIDLMHKGTFDTAREEGQITNRWLMVNVQNVQEFACQMLNRDIWSNQAVKSIVQEHFVFFQVYHDSDEGQRYMRFYKVLDWPYVSVIDPRTGENLVVWNKVDAVSFCDLVTEFLSGHPSVDGSTVPPSPPAKRQKMDSIVDASEDSQLEAAIQASLVEAKQKVESRAESEDDTDVETFDSDSEGSNKRDGGVTKQNSSNRLQRSPDTTDETASEPKPTNSVNNNHSNDDTTTSHWQKYLGDTNDVKSEVVLRFPDGQKKQLSLPASSTLKALVAFVESHGYTSDKYELVTNFPRRRLSQLEIDTVTLKEAGLFPQETVFIQAR